MIFFYRSQLGLDTGKFIDETQHQKIIQLVKARTELMERAKTYIESRDDRTVWLCPSCNESTFLITESQCCFCHHKEDIVDCPTCGVENFDSDLIGITNLFDWDFDEGRIRLIENFEMEDSACSECISSVRDKIESIRRSRYDEEREKE